jgi:bifunctional UDP-N-acetylglucosamine pyrophosphorylase/glucosamine-1-phosphate N-acetyltransferase
VNITAIILAAGKGTRMYSELPKVLHPLAKRPLLQYVIDAANSIVPNQLIVVCGYKAELVQRAFAHLPINWVVQEQQLGTGDAVRCALSQLRNTDKVLVLCGDVPLIEAQTLQRLICNTPDDAVGLLTVKVSDPYGFGRIIRNKAGHLIGIVEEKDATEEQRKIKEINPGVYLLPKNKLSKWLAKLSTNNEQKELYLTDIIALAAQDGVAIHSEEVQQEEEVMGVNTRNQLAALERFYQRHQAEKLMRQGVSFLDPNRIDIRGNVKIAADVTIDVNVILEGNITIENGVIIGPNVYIKDSHIGTGTEILANSVIDTARIGINCQIGPFARIRPSTVLQDKVKIGNFVEVKNAVIGVASKANHLSYLGDTDIGTQVNIGAGVITCNYDGANKHKTTIGNNVSVGADVQLIAPVIVGNGATIAAGTTVMKDIPEQVLALNAKQQQHVDGWQRPTKMVKETTDKV